MGRRTVETSEQDEEYAALWVRSVLIRLLPAVDPEHYDQPRYRRMLKVRRELAGRARELKDDGAPDVDIADEIRARLDKAGFGWVAEARDEDMRRWGPPKTLSRAPHD